MLHPSTDIIMNAQQFFAADQSEANLVKLLHAVSVILQEGAEVLIPTAADAPEGQLLPIPPKGKHFFGAVTVGENGVFRLPEKALEVFSIRSGEELLVLGEDGNGIALVKKDIFLQRID